MVVVIPKLWKYDVILGDVGGLEIRKHTDAGTGEGVGGSCVT